MLKDLREITFAVCHFMPKYLECLSISTLLSRFPDLKKMDLVGDCNEGLS